MPRMSLTVPDEYVPLIITALEHYYAYTRAVQRDDARYREVADWFKRKPPGKSGEPQAGAKRKGR